MLAIILQQLATFARFKEISHYKKKQWKRSVVSVRVWFCLETTKDIKRVAKGFLKTHASIVERSSSTRLLCLDTGKVVPKS